MYCYPTIGCTKFVVGKSLQLIRHLQRLPAESPLDATTVTTTLDDNDA